MAALDEIRVSALGKKGRITDLMKTLGALPAEERKARGAALNVVKDEIAAAIDARQKILSSAALQERLARESIDVTLSARPQPEGRVHPISQTIDELVTIFASMGFAVAKGPDIESEYYNFEALNIPSSHPAREMQETFFLPPTGEHKTILRTHTSPVQIRTMMKPEAADPHHSSRPHLPLRPRHDAHADVPSGRGAGHRRGDAYGASERLPDGFPARIFRHRRSAGAFPPDLISPSPSLAPKSISAVRARAASLKIGNFGDWLEIGGCGMVHPNVLRNCGIDPDEISGLRFRHGHRAPRDAEIRHPRSAHLLRCRYALAEALRFLRRSIFRIRR